jgi:hypothetical protein
MTTWPPRWSQRRLPLEFMDGLSWTTIFRACGATRRSAWLSFGSLDLMARSIDKLALRLMKAIKAEWNRCHNLQECRLVGELAVPICKSEQEFESVFRFITVDKHLVDSVRRGDGHAAKPNAAGDSWIASHETPFTLQRLYWIVGTIGVAFAIWWAVFSWLHR